ncbi:MAG: hypothetical protein ACYDDF_14965 [Thermoplasmatota archaeon]
MFSPIRRDRRALFAIVGLAACAAYVAGGLAIVGALQYGAQERTSAYASTGILAWQGPNPYTSNATAPNGTSAVVFRLGLANASGPPIAAVVSGHAPVVTGMEPALAQALGNDSFLGIPSTAPPEGWPESWVYVNNSTFSHLVAGRGGSVLFFPGRDAWTPPPGWTAVQSTGAPAFATIGLSDAGRAALVLAVGTSVVVLLLARSLLAVAIQSRAADLRLLHALGETRNHLLLRSLRWALRVGAIGLVGGTFSGVGLVLGVAHILLGARATPIQDLFPPNALWLPATCILLMGGAGAWGAFWGARGALRSLFGTESRPTAVSTRLSLSLVVAVFVAATLILSSAASAQFFYGSSDSISNGALFPTSSRVDANLGDQLVQVGAIHSYAAEVLSIGTANGQPLLIRGSNPASLLALYGGSVTEGRFPQGTSEIMIGAGTASNLHLSVGDWVAVVPSFTPGLLALRVVGVYNAPGLLNDEAVVQLTLGRVLANVPSDKVSIFEVRAIDDSVVREFAEGDQFPTLIISVPSPAEAGVVPVRITDGTNSGFPGANVTADNRTLPTDVDGFVFFNWTAGNHTVVATAPGYEVSAARVFVSGPPLASGRQTPTSNGTQPPLNASGGETSAPKPVVLVTYASTKVGLEPMGPPTTPAEPHFQIRAPNESSALNPPQLEVDPNLTTAGNLSTLHLARQAPLYGTGNNLRVATPASPDPFQVVVTELESAILAIMILASALLCAGLATIYGRHLWERRADAALMRDLGASGSEIASTLTKRGLLDGVWAGWTGTILGTTLAILILWEEPLTFFGHTLPFRVEGISLTVVPITVMFLVAFAFLSVRRASLSTS